MGPNNSNPVYRSLLDMLATPQTPILSAIPIAPARKPGTDKGGRDFSPATKLAVWQKATVAPDLDPAQYRLDACGAVITWARYGDTTPGGNGWEIDHIYPFALGGLDDIGNLQALQWQNNRKKGDRTDMNYCEVFRSRS